MMVGSLFSRATVVALRGERLDLGNRLVPEPLDQYQVGAARIELRSEGSEVGLLGGLGKFRHQRPALP